MDSPSQFKKRDILVLPYKNFKNFLVIWICTEGLICPLSEAEWNGAQKSEIEWSEVE